MTTFSCTLLNPLTPPQQPSRRLSKPSHHPLCPLTPIHSSVRAPSHAHHSSLPAPFNAHQPHLSSLSEPSKPTYHSLCPLTPIYSSLCAPSVAHHSSLPASCHAHHSLLLNSLLGAPPSPLNHSQRPSTDCSLRPPKPSHPLLLASSSPPLTPQPLPQPTSPPPSQSSLCHRHHIPAHSQTHSLIPPCALPNVHLNPLTPPQQPPRPSPPPLPPLRHQRPHPFA